MRRGGPPFLPTVHPMQEQHGYIYCDVYTCIVVHHWHCLRSTMLVIVGIDHIATRLPSPFFLLPCHESSLLLAEAPLALARYWGAGHRQNLPRNLSM